MHKHRPKTQTVVTRTLVFVLIIFILLALIALQVSNKKRKVFIQSNIEQVENSVKIAISLESNRLKQVAFDYSFWDEMVQFIKKPDEKWVNENIAPIISTFHTDFISIVDTLNNVVYGSVSDGYNSFRDVVFSNDVLKRLKEKRFVDFYILTKQGVLDVHGATVHYYNDASRTNQPEGMLIIGKLIDSAYVSRISALTGTKIVVDSIPPKSIMPFVDHSIHLSIPLYDLDGAIVAFVNVEKSYEFINQYSMFSVLLIVLFIVSSVLVIVLLTIVMSIWVNRPLKIVEQALANEDSNKAIDLEKYGSEFVEIGHLIGQSILQKKIMAELKDKAEESDKLKSAFLANMSHEIRTPLNAISGFAELLCMNSPDDSESKSYKKIIMNSSSELLHLINDILDYSKIEAGQLVLSNEVFSLNQLFDELNITYQKKLESKHVANLEIRFVYGHERVNLNLDRQRVKQILINLLDNALKFTDKGIIEVGTSIKGNDCVIWVKDTGIGIPEDSLELIFERFRQAAKTPTKIYGGTGLGLSICKGLTQMLGGDIWVDHNPNGGAIFSFSLPFDSKLDLPKSVENKPFDKVPNWKGKSFLVVEDDNLAVKLISQFLKYTGVEIVAFDNAELAIDSIKVREFDLILMDIRILGEIDGLEATKIIKRLKPNIPIIAQTAFAMDLDKERALISGCDYYLSKPFTSEMLINAITVSLK